MNRLLPAFTQLLPAAQRTPGLPRVQVLHRRFALLAIALGLVVALAAPTWAAQPFVRSIVADGVDASVRVQVVETDDDGSLFVAGMYGGTCRFTSNLILSLPKAKKGLFLAKQDANGGWVWAKQIREIDADTDLIVYDLSLGGDSIILGGEFRARNNGPSQGFVGLQSKQDPAAAPAFQFYSTVGADGGYVAVKRVDVGPDGALYAGGKFRAHITDGTTTYDGIRLLTSFPYDQDVFVARLLPNLKFQWLVRAGSNTRPLPSELPAFGNGLREDLAGLRVDAAGNVLVVFNVTSYQFGATNFPAYLISTSGSVSRTFHAGFPASSPTDKAYGAVSAVAGKLTPAGEWSVPGYLEFATFYDRIPPLPKVVWDTVATDMRLANGKMYVCGTYQNPYGNHGWLARVGADTLLNDGPVVFLKSPTTDPTAPARVAARGSLVTVAGTMGRTLRLYGITTADPDLGNPDLEITSIQTNQFVAAFDNDLNPKWARTTTRPNDELKPAIFTGTALAYDGFRRVVYWGGDYADNTRRLLLGEEDNPIVLPASFVRTGWLAALEDTGTYREQVRLTIRSQFGPLIVNGASYPESAIDNIYLRNTLITAEVPAQFPAIISDLTGTRQRCTGFRLDGTVVSGDANRYTFPLTADTSLTFNWQTEHRLVIDSDHADAGLSGTAAAGAADPPIGTTWIREGELVNAFVDGLVMPVDSTQVGSRYVVTGYDATGAAAPGRAFPQIAARQQIPQFTMTGPASIKYRWRQQHRLQISTTSESTLNLPLILQVDDSNKVLARGAGSGEFWFDHNGTLLVLARTEDPVLGRALKGWRNADVADGIFPISEYIAPDNAVSDSLELDQYLDPYNDGSLNYLGLRVSKLTRPARVSWDYGDLVYRVETAIGDPLVLPGGVPLAAGRPPLGVRLVDSPPGSTLADMQIWDDVADRALPLRPGIYYVDWDNGKGGRLVTQVFAGFPGDPIPGTTPTRYFPGTSHYHHIADSLPEVTPPVDLDPSRTDGTFFHALKFQTGTAIVADGKFTATSPGKAVLLFSRSTNSALPAVGDLNREPLVVRVAETRMWDSRTDWSGQAEMVKGPAPAVVGAPLTSGFDTAQRGSGYLVHPIANYNAELYDRASATGPIIPVNRQLLTDRVAHERELVVVWYQKVDGIDWPHQPVRYGPIQWPAPPTGPNPPPTALKRIVIASRLGSEGLDAAGNEQPTFGAPRYANVKIYNQPDRDQPGFNPNEEHARLFPSFLHAADGVSAPTAYALRDDLNLSAALIEKGPRTLPADQYTSDPYVLVQYFDHELGQAGMAVYAVEREDPAIHDPRLLRLPGTALDTYEFRYAVKAGEPVQPPYPLNLLVGLNPCVNTVPNLFSSASALPNGSYFEDGNRFQRAWFVDHKGQTWAASGDSYFHARYLYPLADDFWYPGEQDQLAGTPAVGVCLPWLPLFRPTDGIFGVFDDNVAARSQPVAVRFETTWPEDAPVLKVGETLTYPGGEYKADHPEAPGLPGILGWAAGEVIFDSLNPAMAVTGTTNHINSYVARILSPLDDRRVSLPNSGLPDSLKAGSPDVRVDGDTWYFTKLSPSLQKRVFYQPLAKVRSTDGPGVLGFRGFVNDRTAGASDLTAAPPPVYVLEPNVLTGTERTELSTLSDAPAWRTAVSNLFVLSRNPEGIDPDSSEGSAANWLPGLQPATLYDADGSHPHPAPDRAVPLQGLGPGLALVTNPRLLDPDTPFSVGYVTLAENNHPSLGSAPVALHVIKVDRNARYRGAIKTILPPNVFDEKISLRHTADFGGNVDDVAFAWWYREEDGRGKTGEVPPGGGAVPLWNAFSSAAGTPGQVQIELQGNPTLLLADNLFFVRYRHLRDDKPASARWSEWAGAANSSVRDLDGDGRPDYRPQLAGGWVKRVLDAVNPYEARIREFTQASSPATAASFVQQLGAPYVGPVALNADKNVLENVGLIELYETVLDRARHLSIDASQPAFTPGINAAILLASTRLADFYTLLGDEARQDATDPTVGFGNSTIDPGVLGGTRFCFENQLPTLLDEELALLRGTDENLGRPVYNRLFWNFTKGQGEVAYALNYQIKDVNNDGFVDESDALKLYPQGHGDAWGYYLSAMRKRYDLLRHSLFDWDARSEYYNLLDTVLAVDYADEQHFAQTAANRSEVGADIVAQTYRQRYVEDPGAQWQGYLDVDANRAWGVTEWARRAGQAAYFDWITANALLAPIDTDPTHTGLRRIDRRTVTAIARVSANLGVIQTTLDASNGGLNPLGLDPDVVPFDIDPTHIDVGSTAQIGRAAVQGQTHFEQIFERAFAALKNADEVFQYANAQKARLRQIGEATDQLRQDAIEQDLSFRNRLIEIFGTPYSGTVGPGKPYPAGYNGPDLNLFMYVDVNAIDASSTPQAAPAYFEEFVSFHALTNDIPEPYRAVATQYFLKHDGETDITYDGNTTVELLGDDILRLRLPATAADYTFVAPDSWGQRAAPGRLQTIVSDLLQTEADLALAVGDYDYLYKQIRDRIEVLRVRSETEVANLDTMAKHYDEVVGLTTAINALRVTSASTIFSASVARDIADAVADGLPKVLGVANDTFFGGRLALTTYGTTTQYLLRLASLVTDQSANVAESSKEILELRDEIKSTRRDFEPEIAGMLGEIEELLVNEGVSRIKIFGIREQLRSLLDQYRAALQEGARLLEERRDYNVRVAALTQDNRYHDLTFRVARNEALEKYRSAYDLAARYAYLAAKAYDYETNFDHNDRGSALPLLNEIVRERSLGELGDNQPMNHGGLAGILARLYDNFRVVEGRLGFNNLQLDTTEFSLRRELLRKDSDAAWAQSLRERRVDDLWARPEFRRFCRPFAARDGAQPGLVIHFGTEVTAGRNFFGQPLGPGDSAYDPTLYATKIRAAGIHLDGYPVDLLSRTPYVYLVPGGFDRMIIPDSPTLQVRTWNVVDQAIPVPYNTSAADIGRPNWIASVDTLNGALGAIRRFSSFRAGTTDEDPTLNATRFIGRSVSNTDWFLVIPGQTLHADPNQGLEQLIAHVSDIRLVFETYGYSGN